MTDALRLLVRQPVLGQTAAERDRVLAVIKSALDAGKIVVVGGNTCAFCGAELGNRIPEPPMVTGHGPTRLILRLCDSCFQLAKKAEAQR